ncbi:MAG: K+/H+ antiporter subunit F [Rubrivivax sp.]
MTALVMPWVLLMLALALLLNLWRLLRGPALPDRVLALDTVYINSLALLVVVGMQLRSGEYFEIALLIGLLGFIGTVVLAKFVLRGDIAR